MSTENTKFPDYSDLKSKNSATRKMKADQAKLPLKQQGYWYKGKLYKWEGTKRVRVTQDRLESQRQSSLGEPRSRAISQSAKSDVRRARERGGDGKVYSSPEQKELAYQKRAEIKAYNKANNLVKGDPRFKIVEHRIQIANDMFWNSPQGKAAGRPNDGWNLIGTTIEQYNVKNALEQKIKGFPFIVDVDEVSGNLRIAEMSEYDSLAKGTAVGEEIFLDADLDDIANLYKNKAASDWLEYSTDLPRNIGREFPIRQRPRLEQRRFTPDGFPIDDDFEAAIQQKIKSSSKVPLGDRIEAKLNEPFDYAAQGLEEWEYNKLGVWHDAETLSDSWIKISRELNTDSGKFDDATGQMIYSKDPTARTSIDIQSKIGQGQGQYSDIINLKNKFHNIKRALPPGEYYLHADNYTKAMYYLREFKNDPWVSLSGEYGGQRVKPGPDGYKKYPTLKLTVPDKETQFKQAVEGPYPDWQKQGVPKSSLSGAIMDDDPLKTVSSLAKKNNVQMSAVTSDLGTAMRRAGSVLPFIGAGLDAWDVQQRWEEMIDNPNEGFADYMDKVQFGLASATLGTSFWAEPANFVLGMTNLGIDVARTIAEEDKRENFMKNMRAIGRGATYAAQQLL